MALLKKIVAVEPPSVLDEVTRRLDEGHRVDVCYLDFSKAFDSVSHRYLDLKMKLLGMVGGARKCIMQFLSHRTFRVRVGHYSSTPSEVTSGVPQRLVLEPLLFLMFIINLPQEPSNSCFMFAYDDKIAGANILKDLDAVIKWSNK